MALRRSKLGVGLACSRGRQGLSPAPFLSKLQPVSGAEQPRAEGRAGRGRPSLGPSSGARRLSALSPFPGTSYRFCKALSFHLHFQPPRPTPPNAVAALFPPAWSASWSLGFPAPFLLCAFSTPPPASAPHRWTSQASQGLLAKGPPPRPLLWGWAPRASPLNFLGTRALASRFASSGWRSDPAAVPTPTSGCDT